jgi:5-methyltetrahydropteroyltriglutamate--homocysteine methyltransferase
MKRSTDRILTTHMGSLPRPDVLADLLVAQAEGKPVDAARIPALTDEAMDHIVRRQLDCGIDVGNDGEMPRSTFFGYIIGRMSGFGGRSNRRPILDMQHFPKWWQNFQARGTRRLNVYGFPAAIGPVRYESLDGGQNSARAELDAFARALARQTERFAETFVTAVSPGFAACSMENQHYDSHEAYVFALARELRQEYEFIVAQGHVLQIDSPDLGIERAGYFQDEPLPKFIEAMEMHVAALNEALAGIPPERVRFHACWGNRDSPHVNDVPAPDVLPVCYQVKAGALCLPFANPRHSHEVDAFRTQKLPERMTLVCGVVETTHNYVEHPQVIAERLERAARAVGDRERVMAGTDCGFGTIVGDTQVSEDVVWAKLEAMRDGAAIASKRLWR